MCVSGSIAHKWYKSTLMSGTDERPEVFIRLPTIVTTRSLSPALRSAP
jgi:hypothetical protein